MKEATRLGDSSDFSFACIVLAAGAGKRFGAPKAEARLPDGTRFVDAVARTAARAGATLVVTVLPPGVAAPDGARSVVNPKPDAEPIESTKLALAQLANTSVDGALLWPVDHPFVAAATVRDLAQVAADRVASIVIPVCNGRRGHPTLFARAVWGELMTANTAGARSVVHADPSRIAEVPVADAGVVANVDTKADFERGLRSLTC